MGDGMTGQGVYVVVGKYTDFAPHDLRRTAAKRWYVAGVPLPQIQANLGHADIKTTIKYLGIDQDFVNPPTSYTASLA
jgi:integrase